MPPSLLLNFPSCEWAGGRSHFFHHVPLRGGKRHHGFQQGRRMGLARFSLLRLFLCCNSATKAPNIKFPLSQSPNRKMRMRQPRHQVRSAYLYADRTLHTIASTLATLYNRHPPRSKSSSPCSCRDVRRRTASQRCEKENVLIRSKR